MPGLAQHGIQRHTLSLRHGQHQPPQIIPQIAVARQEVEQARQLGGLHRGVGRRHEQASGAEGHHNRMARDSDERGVGGRPHEFPETSLSRRTLFRQGCKGGSWFPGSLHGQGNGVWVL